METLMIANKAALEMKQESRKSYLAKQLMQSCLMERRSHLARVVVSMVRTLMHQPARCKALMVSTETMKKEMVSTATKI